MVRIIIPQLLIHTVFLRSIGPIYSPYVHNADGTNVFDANGDKVYEWQSTRGANASTW
jgi:hypothetical protein